MGGDDTQLRMGRPGRWSLARWLLLLQGVTLVVVVGVLVTTQYLRAEEANLDAARDEVLAVAHTLAAQPDLRAGLAAADPVAELQPLAERVRHETGTDFIVVMTPDGTRFTHPDPARIGGRFRGTLPAPGGEPVVETFTGTLGPSVRAVVPVVEGDRVVGLVAVGTTLTAVGRELAEQLPLLLGFAAGALLLAAAGSWAISGWLRRTTHDLGAVELARMYEFYDAVLHAVREGLLLLDRDGRVQLVNDEARRLLALPADAVGRPVADTVAPAALGAALAAGTRRVDEIHLTSDRILVVNQAAARWAGRHLGTVVTLRDHTELRSLVTELQTIRGFADALHAQAHEAANQLHTVVSLLELGRPEQALEYAGAELAVAQRLTDAVVGTIAVPELAALLVGKAAAAGERGVELRIEDGTAVPAGVADPRDLVTIVGNLLDNAVDAALTAPGSPWVRFGARTSGGDLVITIADSGPGLCPQDRHRVFERGFSTKPDGTGLGRGLGLSLVQRAVHRLGGRIDVEREAGALFTVRVPESMPAGHVT